MKTKKQTALLGRIYLIICLIVALFPIYWMINTSFKSDSEIYAKIPTLIPHHPTGGAYAYLINNTNFLASMKNSLIIAISVSVFSILIAYPVAYTLSRVKFKGRRVFSKSVLFFLKNRKNVRTYQPNGKKRLIFPRRSVIIKDKIVQILPGVFFCEAKKYIRMYLPDS